MRIRPLDSLRGVAALVVLFHHLMLSLPFAGDHGNPSWITHTPLLLLVSGPAAVVVFFVLSGFVLTLNLTGPTPTPYRAFVSARLIRIWVPFACAILLSAAFSATVGALPVIGASAWFSRTWLNPVTPGSVGAHLAMLGTVTDLDGPMWSLIHELRVSLIFPLLLAMSRGRSTMMVGVSVMLGLACVYVVKYQAPSGILLSIVKTGTYLFTFVIGIALALHWNAIGTRAATLKSTTRAALWLIVVAGLMIAPNDVSIIANFRAGCLLITTALVSALIIVLCAVDGKVSAALQGRAATYLGRISYSLYLMHIIVIATVLHVGGRSLPVPFLVALCLPLSIVIADIFQRLVEQPSHKLARRLGRRSITVGGDRQIKLL